MSRQRLSPRDGDVVRARLDTRGRDVVHGVLRLRPVADGHVAVEVLLRTGALRHVDPGTVRVVEPRSVRTAATPAPWTPTLEDLRQQGRIRPVRVRQGGSWQDMIQRLDQAVRPLVQASWAAGEYGREESGEFGDSVRVPLERGTVHCDAELYEDDALALWGVGGGDDDATSGDPSEAQWFGGDLSEASLRDWYRALGLLP